MSEGVSASPIPFPFAVQHADQGDDGILLPYNLMHVIMHGAMTPHAGQAGDRHFDLVEFICVIVGRVTTLDSFVASLLHDTIMCCTSSLTTLAFIGAL